MKAGFECRFCVKKFSSRGHRDRHERTHTGERPFACSYCPRRFKCKNNQKRHTNYCRQNPEACRDRPFKCHFCHKTFRYSFDRARHWNKNQCQTLSLEIEKKQQELAAELWLANIWAE